MKIQRRQLFTLLTLVAVVASPSFQAHAQSPANWPGKQQSIRLVVPASAGGSLDVITRPMAVRLGEILGTTVIVENRGGAGGVLGADLVAKAPADGHTFLMAAVHHAIAPAVYPKMPYDSEKDLIAVAHMGTVPNMVVVGEKVPARSLGEFVKWAKANPKGVNYATGGAGTMHHLSTEMFKQQAGVEMTAVHYRGSGPGITDLVAGNVQVMFETLPSAVGHVRSGRLHPLAVTSAQRNPLFPDVPTVAESGYPQFEASTWYGLMAPARTSPEIVKAMNAAVQQALKREDIQTTWRSLGVATTPMSAAEFQTFWLAELKRWGAIAKSNNISLE